MPAYNLSQASCIAGQGGVVAQYSGTADRFVRHIALSRDQCVSKGDNVCVAHMGPPLDTSRKVEAHAIGVLPLSNDEVKEIDAWIQEVIDEYDEAVVTKRHQYIIHPPSQDKEDQNTGVRRYRRFSCAGFVLDAYREVEIELLITNEDDLPEVDRATLDKAYPEIRVRPKILERFGVSGEGPWRIVLAGYVLHAMNRSAEEIRETPYRPDLGDEHF